MDISIRLRVLGEQRQLFCEKVSGMGNGKWEMGNGNMDYQRRKKKNIV